MKTHIIKILTNKKTLLFLALLQLTAATYYLFFFHQYGFLPSPFLNDKTNTFMDFYNTMCWYSRGEYYSTWNSIYPPINFILTAFLQEAFGTNQCYFTPDLYRSENIHAILVFIVLVITTPIFILLLSRKLRMKPHENISFFIIMLFSPAILFTVERGNLVILCLLLLSIFIYTRKNYTKIFIIALLINIKPYFLILSIYFLAKRQPENFIITGVVSFLIFFIAGQTLPENQFLIIDNILSFSQSSTIFSIREALSFPPNISSFSYILSAEQINSIYTSLFFLSPYNWSILLSLTKNALLLVAIIGLLKNAHLMNHMSISLLLVAIITNLSTTVGGYVLSFYLAFIPFLYSEIIKKSNFDWNQGIIFLFIIAISLSTLDMFSLVTQNIGEQLSFLSGKEVMTTWSITLGTILRPVLNFFLLAYLTYKVYQIDIKAIKEHLKND